MATFMQRYPRLVRYKATSPYPGIVVFLMEPHLGIAVYVPAGVPAVAENYPGEQFTPSSTEIEEYSGSVILRSSTDPTLGS